VTASVSVAAAASPATFAFTAEHAGLRSMVRRFLSDQSPEAEVRRLMETVEGYDPRMWAIMAERLGLQGLLIPERFGGVGSGVVELQIVCEEMGAALLCAPFLASAVLATSALVLSDDEEMSRRHLPGLADGTTIATLAVTEETGSWAAAEVTTLAVPAPDGDGYRLTGEKQFVLDGMVADLLLVVARTERGPSLFAVSAGAAGVVRTAMPTLDTTRKQARVALADTPAVLVGRDGAAAAPIAAAVNRGIAALAAEQAGGARRVLDMAVAYAKVREQFGRPIGSYQVIKHKCADMLLNAESAVSAAYALGWAIDEGSTEAGMLASLAKAYCSEAFYRCAAENIQIHGGIGFTWEHPAHLYFKRATSAEIMLGSPWQHRELLAQRFIESMPQRPADS
jgi:alkylation response protein AidB-like acyl-CoA dehydrogenase